MEANKSITDFISEIKIDRSNLEHIAKTGKINGSLFLEIQDKMRAFASQELLCAIPDYESNKTAECEIDIDILCGEITGDVWKAKTLFESCDMIKPKISAYSNQQTSTLQKELEIKTIEGQHHLGLLFKTESKVKELQKELDETKQKLQESETTKVIPLKSFLRKPLRLKTGNAYYEKELDEAIKKYEAQFKKKY